MAGNPVHDVLNTALQREKEGHQFYLKAAEATANEKGKQMFRWLAAVEQGHIDKLTRQLKSYRDTGKLHGVEQTATGHVTAADLPPVPKVAGKVTADTKELDALAMAIQAEKDGYSLYSGAARDIKDPEANKLLAQLARDEQEHLAVLEEEQNWLKRSGEYFTIHRFQLPA